MLANEITIYHPYMYYLLRAASKSNFESLFDFVKKFQKYLKKPKCKIDEKVGFFISLSSQEIGKAVTLHICESSLNLLTIYSTKIIKMK